MIDNLRALAARLRGLFGDRKAENEFDDEIQAHIESLTDRYIRQGMTRDEAASAARRQFGNLTMLKEDNREMRGISFIETIYQDVWYGLWMLRRNPGFTFVAVLTLALGIGANTAIFSVVNAVLLRSLPYREADQLVLLSHSQAERVGNYAFEPDFLDWREQSKSFAQIAAYRISTVDLTGSGEPERLAAGFVSAELFATLGVTPALGRTFTPAEDTYGGTPVVILSDSLWQRRFGRDPQVIGRALTLGGQSRTVVGIMPLGFRFPEKSDLWLPLATNVAAALSRRTYYAVSVIARLKPGLTVEAARVDASLVLDRLRQAFPQVYSRARVRVIGLSDSLVGNVRLALLMILGAVAFVLFIACANVANLLLARSTARQREMAIRTAIGAGRLRIIRQLLTESLLLSLAGGAIGLLAAKWAVRLLVALSPAGIPRIEESGVDGQVLGFTCLVVLLVGMIVGIIPALQASKVDVSEMLKAQSSVTSGGRRIGYAGVRQMLPPLMIVELALALILLVGAGLLIKSFLRLLAVPKGFNPTGVLTLALSPNKVKNPSAYIQESLDRVRALPGIQSAALTGFIPLSGPIVGRRVREFLEGRPPYEQGKEPSIDVISISPKYFQTLGIEMRAGRPFTAQDGVGTLPVAIINETTAQRFFPNENPIGHRLLDPSPATIIGVVSDTRHHGLDQDVRPQVYLPRMQYPNFEINYLVARAAPDQNNSAGLSGLAIAIRNQISAIEPNVAANQVVKLDELMANSVAQRRFLMLLLGVFASVAFIIATVGIYGVISYSVSRRTQEIGIRMALGAQVGDVLWMVIWRGMRIALIGVALGLAGALGVTRVMKSLLFEVSAIDPVTFALITLLLIVVALIACYIPARRATRIDPLQALRHE